MPEPGGIPYVSRGGLKLRHALDAFAMDVGGLVCADLGCSTGGFTDCLLQAGAIRVYAVDTAYGELAWKLRKDPRVVVMERTNALHAVPMPVSLVTIDMSWTPQRLVVPAAVRWIMPGGRMISLIKPHYEAKGLGVELPVGGVLTEDVAESIAQQVAESLPAMGVRVLALTRSPVAGGGLSGKKTKGAGNVEWLVLADVQS